MANRKAPAVQFYPGDWRRDLALQSCSLAARGLWLEMLNLMHDGEPYGHLAVRGRPLPLVHVARLVGADLAEVESLYAELEEAGVLSKTPEGVVYSRRMVRDDENRGQFSTLQKAKSRLGNEARWGKRSAKRKPHKKVDGVPEPSPEVSPDDPPASASALALASEDLETPDFDLSPVLEESADNGKPVGPDPDLAARIETAQNKIAGLLEEKRDLPARSTSMPSYDGDEQFRTVHRFLARLYPPQRPGAGLPHHVQVWMSRIPLADMALFIREREAGLYSALPGMKGERGWFDLTLGEQKKIVQWEFGGMLKREDERRRKSVSPLTTTGQPV